MEVILREEIDKLGGRGDVVKVADGYARNFLLPRRLAVPATAANKKIVEQERQAHLRREATAIAEAGGLAKLMENVTVIIKHKAGEQDQLFGSVTARNIADALEKQNYAVDRRKIILNEPIKQLGEYKVPIRLHQNVTVEVGVKVVGENGEEASSEPEVPAEAETAPSSGPEAEAADNAAPEAEKEE